MTPPAAESDLVIRFASVDDVTALAQMNAQLIRDEGHRNPMSLPELAERMRGWLAGEYEAAIVEVGSETAGYALYRRDADYVYLRQLFVRSEFRRRGIGRRTLAWLWKNAWTEAPRLRIDVLIRNEAAIAFWRSVGFGDYCLTMEMPRPDLDE